MRLAFVTNYDSTDMNAWSGSMFNMLGAFRRAGLKIDTIDKLYDPYRAVFVAKRIFHKFVDGRNYLRDREPLTLRSYATQVSCSLSRINPDLIFSA